ncbi:MAG TPA: hypothetical protein PK950_01875 [Candidatus Paceibacterota bacterium]|nr:hypothetical protein [Candidatus Paceibacterota bacterium]
MQIIHYLNQHSLVGLAILIALFLGFFLGFITVGKKLWADIGSMSLFFKEGECYIFKYRVGDYGDNQIYVFQKVTIKNHTAKYSRNFYLTKDSNFSLWGYGGSHDFAADVVFKVEKVNKRMDGKISDLHLRVVKIKMSSNLPKGNVVVC